MSIDYSVDWSRFEWALSADDSLCYRREFAGIELIADFSLHPPARDGLIFSGVEITLRSPLPLTDFVDRLRDVWIALRYTFPIIASQTECDKFGNPFITYRVEPDIAKMKEWAARTICIANGAQGLDELRFDLSLKDLPNELGDQTMLHVCCMTDLQYGLLIHTSHVPVDGIGVKIIFNCLLTSLATYIGGASLPDVKWGSEAVNLTPALPLATTEPLEGSEYTRTLSTIMEDIYTTMPVSHIPHSFQLSPYANVLYRSNMASRYVTLAQDTTQRIEYQLFCPHLSRRSFSGLVATRD